jgi:hypothetical protein
MAEKNSWSLLPAVLVPEEGDVVLAVASDGTMIRIPVAGIGDLLTSPNSGKLGSLLEAIDAAIRDAKADFDKRFAESRLVSDVVNLAADQALGTREILGSTTGGGVPTLDNFNAFFGEIARGNLAGAAQAANAKAIAGIEELKVTYASLTDAIAGTHQIIAAANIDGTAAAVDEEKLARITADQALAAETLTLSATIGGNFSTVNTVAAAFAALNGTLGATYGVTLDVNGYVSGFQAINGGSAGSAFNVRADLFNLVMPNFSATPVLRISNVNGTPTLAFDGRIIADNSLLNNSVADENITTIRGTNFAGVVVGNGLNFISSRELIKWQFIAPLQGPCIIGITSPAFYCMNGGTLSVRLDGTEIGSFVYSDAALGGGITSPPLPIIMNWSGTVPKGTHTVSLFMTVNNFATLASLTGGTVSIVVGSK